MSAFDPKRATSLGPTCLHFGTSTLMLRQKHDCAPPRDQPDWSRRDLAIDDRRSGENNRASDFNPDLWKRI